MKLRRFWLAWFLLLLAFLLLPLLAFALQFLGVWTFLKDGFAVDLHDFGQVIMTAWLLLLAIGVVLALVNVIASRSKKSSRSTIAAGNQRRERLRIQARQLVIAGLVVMAVTLVSSLLLGQLWFWSDFPYTRARNYERAKFIGQMAQVSTIPFVLGIGLVIVGAGFLAFSRDARTDASTN